MRITRTLVVPFLSAIVGFAIGGFVVGRHFIREQAESTAVSEQLSAYQRVRALRQARSGGTEKLIWELELLLDGDIIGLGEIVKSGGENREAAMKALRKAAAYRMEFPRSFKDPELTKAVDHALALANP